MPAAGAADDTPDASDTLAVARALREAVQSGLHRTEAQLLLLHAVGKTHGSGAWLYAHDSDRLSALQARDFAAFCQRRLAGEPVAYITGWRGFYGLDLQVTPAVLDPRPDTETLVDWALEVIRQLPAARVLDVGTGSGAIALAIKSQRPDAQVTAVEASADALEVARGNAERLGLEVTLVLSDWFSALDAGQQFDCIVSNPPYLAADDRHLPDLQHEPQAALVAADAGLGAFREIIAQAGAYLRNGGWLLLEHGWQQHAAVHGLLSSAGCIAPDSRKDLAGHVRCTGGKYIRAGAQ